MKKFLLGGFLFFLFGLLPAGVFAACGVESLPSSKELNNYSSISDIIENDYKVADKLYFQGIIDNSTLRGYYLARDNWNSSYKIYKDNYNNFNKEIQTALTTTGQDFMSHCDNAEVLSKAFVESQDTLKKQTDSIVLALNGFTNRASLTNDKLSSQQWYLKFSKIDNAKISSSPTTIVVAVIDDGIYVNHEDLRDNIWINPREVIGNGKDDDSNGFVDDIYGYDFVGSTAEMTVRGSHGTHVAGIIGAVSDNGSGIQGIVKNIKLMPLIACNDKGSCSTDMVVKAIHYAVDNGASIINLSLGSRGTTSYTTQYDDAVKYAFQRGVLIVAAAGNGDLEGSTGQNLDVGKDPVFKTLCPISRS